MSAPSQIRVTCPRCKTSTIINRVPIGTIVQCRNCSAKIKIGSVASVGKSASEEAKPTSPAISFPFQGSTGSFPTTPQAKQLAQAARTTVSIQPAVQPNSTVPKPSPTVGTQTKRSSKKSRVWVGVGLVSLALLGSAFIPKLIFLWDYAKFERERKEAVEPEVHSGNNARVIGNSGKNVPSQPSGSAGSTKQGSKIASPRIIKPSQDIDVRTQAAIYSYTLDTTRRSQMQLHVYIPKGNHSPESLECVFIAPAGTSLLTGSETEPPNQSDEFTPYLRAGMAVVHYSIDGWLQVENPQDPSFPKQLSHAFVQFLESDAGVENGRQAINQVLTDFPAINPKKLYTVGHSSAGTLSLLLAAQDSRIAKCVAFAPITNLRSRLAEALAEPSTEQLFPGFHKYLIVGSPLTYCDRLKCDVWIAHAKDDDNEPYTVTANFVKTLRTSNGRVQFLSLEKGGHYQEMLNVAIPKALQWLQGRSP